MNQEMFRSLPWPFEGDAFPPALGVVVMRTVLDGARPALQVLHDPEGGWAIADGESDPNAHGALIATHIWHVVAADPSLTQLAAMPPGMQADRLTVDAPWEFRSFSWDE
ncbi:hypothetical protein ACFRAU_25000 [Arthrobacter sp. NPDC056691]|uniref:hypothetical protein n=1 Tax=Arthrobacter sp. NPDC056691 TaxID=3345913 RepID=UPI003670C99F